MSASNRVTLQRQPWPGHLDPYLAVSHFLLLAFDKSPVTVAKSLHALLTLSMALNFQACCQTMTVASHRWLQTSIMNTTELST